MPKTRVTTTLITVALLSGCARLRGSGGTTTVTIPTGQGSMVSSITTLNSARTSPAISAGDLDLLGLQASEISAMNNANIVAHLATDDSLEIQLSQTVLARARSQSVRDFAQRMIAAHTQHIEEARQLAARNGITPTRAAGDTLDASLATRMMNRLTGTPGSVSMSTTARNADDRQLMGAEVAMHRRILRELTMLQPRTTGGTRTLVDETISVVRQHLMDAESLWQQVAGDAGGKGSR